MKKQFDLQYYLEHPETKVVMRDGRKARIICTDLKNVNYPISAAFEEDSGLEFVETFTSKGKFTYTINEEHSKDLFFDIPDQAKKRVPLTYEDLLDRVKSGKSMWIIRSGCAVHIIGFCASNIKCAINFESEKVRLYTYSDMMVWGEFADGDPCWKEVEK